VGRATCEKEGYELVEVEEMVNTEKGCWLRFSKLPPKQDEGENAASAAAKKAPPKGGKGGAPSDELKPAFGRAWVSFEELKKPGSTSLTSRVYLMTCPPVTKRVKEDGSEVEVEEHDFDKIFEESRSYVHIKISLNKPIVPF
jgi:hypothetical protein